MKKLIKFAAFFCLTFTSLLGLSAFAADANDQKQIDELKKTYPLSACPISGEKLENNTMGKPVDYMYAAKDSNGKENPRLVRFCCSGCIKKFNETPDKYLKQIDDAASKKKNADSPQS